MGYDVTGSTLARMGAGPLPRHFTQGSSKGSTIAWMVPAWHVLLSSLELHFPRFPRLVCAVFVDYLFLFFFFLLKNIVVLDLHPASNSVSPPAI